MKKNVLPALIRDDASVPVRVVEPPDRSACHTRPPCGRMDTEPCSGARIGIHPRFTGFSAAYQPTDQCLDAVHRFPPPSKAAEYSCSPSMIRTPAGNRPAGSSECAPATCGAVGGGGVRSGSVATGAGWVSSDAMILQSVVEDLVAGNALGADQLRPRDY